MSKLFTLAAVATGYVLGARAGRERYQQISTQAQRLWQDPRVQKAAAEAKNVAAQQAPVVKGKMADVTGKVTGKTNGKASSSTSSTGSPASAPSPSPTTPTTPTTPASTTPTPGTAAPSTAPGTMPGTTSGGTPSPTVPTA